MVDDQNAESDRHLDLRVGERAELAFEGLGSAGYRWRHEVQGDPEVSSVTWQVGPLDIEPGQSAGASAPEIAVIEARRIGEVAITFLQMRPWERSARPLRSLRVTVRVSGGSNVAI